GHLEPLRFIGRDAELTTALDELRQGSHVVTVCGLSGSGKSRLVREIAAAVPSVYVRAYWPERSEPSSLARALLREVLGLDALAGLPAAAVGELVVDPALATMMLVHTDRSPLAISELLHALDREGVVAADRHGRWRARSTEAVVRAAQVGDLGQRRAILRRAS